MAYPKIGINGDEDDDTILSVNLLDLGNLVTMKKILLALLIILAKSVFAQHPLTIQDRNNYILTVDQSQISKPKWVIINGGKFKTIIVPLKLENKSKETLKYSVMSCSWYEMYQTDNKLVTIHGWPCDKNVPEVGTILSHMSQIRNIPLLTPNNKTNFVRLRIGMYLNKIHMEDKNIDIPIYRDNGKPDYYKNILIWSNEISVKL